MTINKTSDSSKTIFAISGRIDTTTAPELDAAIAAIKANENVVLDFAEVEYISSAGLRVLLKAVKNFAADGSLKLTNVSTSVMEIFEITGFNDILTIE